MDLSIIIPMYNVEKYIVQCLTSIIEQDILLEKYEIIIIDDGSTDNSYRITTKITDKKTNILIVQQKNKGLSATRNYGLSIAKGEYIYFVDSDDYIASNTLNKLLNTVFKYKLDILEFKLIRTTSRDLVNSKSNNLSNEMITVLNGKEYIASRSFNDSVCVYLYNRMFLINSNIRFIEGKTMEDMIFNAELLSKAKRIAFFPLDVYRYVRNPNSIWTNTSPNAIRKSIDDFIIMTIKYSELIFSLKNQDVNTSILENKLQVMFFNITKRLLKSDFNFSELNLLIKKLEKNKLYPIKTFKGKNRYRKVLTHLFNNKHLFYTTMWLYKIFRIPFEKIIIKKHQKESLSTLN